MKCKMPHSFVVIIFFSLLHGKGPVALESDFPDEELLVFDNVDDNLDIPFAVFSIV